MIVFDSPSDAKLVKTLEALRAQPDNSRCLHFKLSQLTPPVDIPAFQAALLQNVQRFISPEKQQVYYCGDGDIFIIAPMIITREGRFLMAEMAKIAGAFDDERFAEMYELNIHVNKILLILEQKLEKKQKAIEAVEKKREEQAAEQKRRAILNDAALANAGGSLEERRHERKQPELMIIEDDAFSRRLVENVLQKQYSLTQLPSAEMALATYAKVAPDLLFLDINLPDVTGHELLEKIIALDPSAYVVMLSGNSDRENITQAMSHGAKGFIAKPFTREKLLQYISRCPTIAKQG